MDPVCRLRENSVKAASLGLAGRVVGSELSSGDTDPPGVGEGRRGSHRPHWPPPRAPACAPIPSGVSCLPQID